MNHWFTFEYVLITLYCASLAQQQPTLCMNQCAQNCLQSEILQCHQSCQQSCGQSTDVQTVSGSFNPPRAFLPLGGPGPALTSSISPSSSLTYGPISGGNGPIYLMPGKPYNPNLRISGNRNIPSIQRYPQDGMIGGSNNMRNSICTEVCMPSCTSQCIASSPILPAVNERPGTIIMGGPGPFIFQGTMPTQGGPGPVIPLGAFPTKGTTGLNIPSETFPPQGTPDLVIPQGAFPLQNGPSSAIPQGTVPIQRGPGVVIEPGAIPIQSSSGPLSLTPYGQSGLITSLNPFSVFVPSEIPNQPRITQCIPSKTHIQCVCPKNYIPCSNNNLLNQCCRR